MFYIYKWALEAVHANETARTIDVRIGSQALCGKSIRRVIRCYR
jgi:hypothetical protein